MQKVTTVETAWERKYPEQVVLAITRNSEGRVNLMAIGWVCIASDEPPMFLIGIDDNAYTLELIRQHKEFVIAYPSAEMADATLYVGTTHGHKEDKGVRCGLKFIPGDKVNVPILADAVANFECRLVEITRPGNCPLIVGEIVASHVNVDESVERLFTLDKGYKLGKID
jgi:flavin reductase (DIM6/NTAB) family NADH-FMN oxidoreductase RutF